MTTKEEIEKLEQRKDMAAYQRKITTCLGTAIEYDQEIAAIDRWVVEDIIDQQRHINRLISLIDFIMGSSAKGVLLVPDNVIHEDKVGNSAIQIER